MRNWTNYIPLPVLDDKQRASARTITIQRRPSTREGILELARELKVNYWTLHRWLNEAGLPVPFYEAKGKWSLAEKQAKTQELHALKDAGKTVTQAARELGVAKHTAWNWVKGTGHTVRAARMQQERYSDLTATGKRRKGTPEQCDQAIAFYDGGKPMEEAARLARIGADQLCTLLKARAQQRRAEKPTPVWRPRTPLF